MRYIAKQESDHAAFLLCCKVRMQASTDLDIHKGQWCGLCKVREAMHLCMNTYADVLSIAYDISNPSMTDQTTEQSGMSHGPS